MCQLMTAFVKTVGMSLGEMAVRRNIFAFQGGHITMPKQRSGLKCADCQSEQKSKLGHAHMYQQTRPHLHTQPHKQGEWDGRMSVLSQPGILCNTFTMQVLVTKLHCE